MASIVIKLEIQDINVSLIDDNIMIKCDNGLNIVFTPLALNELINDYKTLKKNKKYEIK